VNATRAWLGIGLLTAGALLAGCSAADANGAKDGVLVHISHGQDDPHRVLMALNMAAMMSVDHDVLVYFDIRGVVLADAEEISFSHFPPSKQQLGTLAGNGVTLMACPGCLKAAGKTADDLAPGVDVATKERFFSFSKGRIVTLDY
jgi:predicted peroxiredoxin